MIRKTGSYLYAQHSYPEMAEMKINFGNELGCGQNQPWFISIDCQIITLFKIWHKAGGKRMGSRLRKENGVTSTVDP